MPHNPCQILREKQTANSLKLSCLGLPDWVLLEHPYNKVVNTIACYAYYALFTCNMHTIPANSNSLSASLMLCSYNYAQFLRRTISASGIDLVLFAAIIPWNLIRIMKNNWKKGFKSHKFFRREWSLTGVSRVLYTCVKGGRAEIKSKSLLHGRGMHVLQNTEYNIFWLNLVIYEVKQIEGQNGLILGN